MSRRDWTLQNGKQTWAQIARAQPRLHSCHEALERSTDQKSAERVSKYAHQPSALLHAVGDEMKHSLPDVVKAREQMSMQWVEAYATSVATENCVRGQMLFVKPDSSLPNVLSILTQYSGSAK